MGSRSSFVQVCSLCLVLFLFCFVAERFPLAVCGSDDVVLRISGAESAVGQAYVAVSEAEGAGANVSGLVAKLNEAGELLARANTAFRAGDSANADSLVGQCLVSVDGIVVDAKALKGQAESAGQSRLFLTVALSSVGLSVLFVVSLFAWRFLKWRYIKRVLGMKPEEVVEG